MISNGHSYSDCTASLVPLELFLLEIWQRHGFFSLLLLLLPLLGVGPIAMFWSRRYYRTKRFEANGTLYERLGIRFFQRFVSDGDYVNRIARRNDAGYKVISDDDSILRVEAGTRWSECLHVAWLVLTLPSTVYALMLGWNKFALGLFLPGILLHFYLVLLQRYTRARIQRVLGQRRRKSSGKRREDSRQQGGFC